MKAGLLHEVWTEGMTRWQKVKSNKDFHFHDLRHTAASHAIMGSKDPYAVQSFLRLKTQSLMQRYAHLSPGHVRQAALTLDKQLPLTTSPQPILIAESENIPMTREPIRNPNNVLQPTTTNN